MTHATNRHKPAPIELLAPARNLECGIEAIRHGADAVYIGAPRFGARAAAGNSIADIASLVEFAHTFGARIYVTLNTLLCEDELAAAHELIATLAAKGVDAIITQDPRLRPADAPIPLHSSTQMDNRTADDVRRRLNDGYTQTVLARELSLNDIQAIHAAVPQMPLEAFVHGALCVSYSGRCYASERLFGRSANRGECAQVCRLPFQLVEASGNGPVQNVDAQGTHKCTNALGTRPAHYLSLRDMNRSAHLEAMMDAGISSFKIEGRLKDVDYVKNTTAFYSQLIDAIIRRRPADFCRASHGTSTITFTPDPTRSFNRGFTDYFLLPTTQQPSTATQLQSPAAQSPTEPSIGSHECRVAGGSAGGAQHPPTTQPHPHPLANFATPKSMGQHIGKVKGKPTEQSLSLFSTAPISAGDGLCFIAPDGHLQGFRVNRVDELGRIFPADPSVLRQLHPGTVIHRNHDAAFHQQLSRPTADRRIHVSWHMAETKADQPNQTAIRATITDEAGHTASRTLHLPTECARTPQAPAIIRQLTRLGDTPYATTEDDIHIDLPSNPFIPASMLGNLRRQLCQDIEAQAQQLARRQPSHHNEERPSHQQPYLTDASQAKQFSQGQTITTEPPASRPLMTCRYCLRRELGACLRQPNAKHLPEHMALRLADGRTLPLLFDCQRCQMLVMPPRQ